MAHSMWQFMDNSGSWVSFAPEHSDLIMDAFVRGDRECIVTISSVAYAEDLDKLVQRNPSTGKQRQIRYDFGLPAHWTVIDNDMLQGLRPKAATSKTQHQETPSTSLGHMWQSLFGSRSSSDSSDQKTAITFHTATVSITDPGRLAEFTTLLRDSVFHHNSRWLMGETQCDQWHRSFEVKQVFHVENVSLFKSYLDHCKRMRCKHMDHGILPEPISPPFGTALLNFGESIGISSLVGTTLNEGLLCHGTSFDVAKQIAVDGFDSRVSKPGYYGMGTFFCVAIVQECPIWRGHHSRSRGTWRPFLCNRSLQRHAPTSTETWGKHLL